jgi:hypothetical protein
MATNPRRPFAGTGRNPIPFTPDSLPDWLQVPYSGQGVHLRGSKASLSFGTRGLAPQFHQQVHGCRSILTASLAEKGL